jgi:dolichol kinase
VTPALATDSQVLAEDVYALLRELDPARWRDDAEAAVRERVAGIRARIAAVVEAVEAEPTNAAFGAVGTHMAEMGRLMDGSLPARGLAGRRLRVAWNDFRLEVQPVYEQLAASLRPLEIHVPSLRPTNYARNVYHVFSGFFAIWLIEWVLPPSWLLPVAGGCAALAWAFEIGRRRSSWINSLLMAAFRPFAHPHEAWRINSATWFTSSLVLLALTGRPVVASTALVILALADPAAALVGRRFGTIKLVNGRSLQGTLTFFVVGVVAALALLSWLHPELGPVPVLGIAIAGSAGGAIAELFARRVDDNLAIPVSVAGASLAVLGLTGLL